jgi:hypothetical protein
VLGSTIECDRPRGYFTGVRRGSGLLVGLVVVAAGTDCGTGEGLCRRSVLPVGGDRLLPDTATTEWRSFLGRD